MLLTVPPWLVFALLAPAIYAAITFSDKYVVEDIGRGYRAMPVVACLLSLIFGLLLCSSPLASTIQTRDAALAFIVGLLSGAALFLYVEALSRDTATNVNLFFQVTPVLSLLFAFVLLHEVVSPLNLLGFALILAAAVLGDVRSGSSARRLSKAFVLILGYVAIYAFSGVVMKFVIERGSFAGALGYESIGMGMAGALIWLTVPAYRRVFSKALIRKLRWTALIILVNEALFLLARAITYYALSQGPVALVSVLGGTQALFAVAYGGVLGRCAPGIFGDRTDRKALGMRAALAAVTVVGIRLLV